MMLATVGNKWIAACHIWNTVGDARFRCSDVEDGHPNLRCQLKDMCDCGILIKHRMVHRGRVHEYQLAPEAITKIRRYGE